MLRGEKKKRRREEDLVQGPDCNFRGLFARKKGGGRACPRKEEKRKGWLQKCRGWKRKTARGRIRVWRLGGLGLGLGYSLAISQNIFILQKIIWKLIFRNRDDRLDKIFSDNFRKIK